MFTLAKSLLEYTFVKGILYILYINDLTQTNNSLNTLYLPNGDIAKNLKFVIGECDVECTMLDNNIGLYCGSVAVDSLSNFHNDAFAIIPFACYNKAYYGYNGTVSLQSDLYVRVNSKYSCTMKVRCLLIVHDVDS